MILHVTSIGLRLTYNYTTTCDGTLWGQANERSNRCTATRRAEVTRPNPQPVWADGRLDRGTTAQPPPARRERNFHPLCMRAWQYVLIMTRFECPACTPAQMLKATARNSNAQTHK